MYSDISILLAAGENGEIRLPLSAAVQHGMITGAPNSGKSVTVRVMAEAFSDAGVPVFCSDIDGALAGLCREGTSLRAKSYPVRFWDCFGKEGLPVRFRLSDVGPQLTASVLGLTEAQKSLLDVVFRAADDAGLELIDIKDLRAMLKYVNDNRKEYSDLYGTVSTASVNAIQRAVLAFENTGAADVFGEPALDVSDLFARAADGRGTVSLLNAGRLSEIPALYSAAVLWLLLTLCDTYSDLPEGEAPRAALFFDSAETLFAGAPKDLIAKTAHALGLLSRKGIAVFFAARSVKGIPAVVAERTGNRLQHVLPAYTQEEIKEVRAAAAGFRTAPGFDAADAIASLMTGEALFGLIGEDGFPAPAVRGKVREPNSRIGAVPSCTVADLTAADPLYAAYSETEDRYSAYESITEAEEKLAAEIAAAKAEEEAAAAKAKADKKKTSVKDGVKKTAEKAVTSAASSAARAASTNIVNSIAGGKKKSAGQIAKQAATSALSSVLRSGATSVIRGLFGIKKK